MKAYRRTGIITPEELGKLGLIPPKERLERGPVAIAECPEHIPCNVCIGACPMGAITVEGLTGVPRIAWDKCTGCGKCVGVCPGLAIFVVDLSRDPAVVVVPHEFLPRPKKGDVVSLLNRRGEKVGEGVVRRVFEVNKTLVVAVEVPRELAMEVRAIWVS